MERRARSCGLLARGGARGGRRPSAARPRQPSSGAIEQRGAGEARVPVASTPATRPTRSRRAASRARARRAARRPGSASSRRSSRAESTGWRSGASSALAKRPRSSAGAKRPAWPATPPSAQALPSCTSPQTSPASRRWSPSSSVAAISRPLARRRPEPGRAPSRAARRRVSAKSRSSGVPAQRASAQPSSM